MSSFFDLVAELQASIDNLDKLLSGNKTETVSIGGVSKDTISKAINDKFGALSAMMQGRIPFSTKALMNADISQSSDQLAEVWNDTNQANNGIYGFTGSQWLKSAYSVQNVIDMVNQNIPVTGKAVVDYAEKLTVSLKNLFNPVTDVIIGKEYSSTGATILSGGRAATPFYPIAAGQTVSISGMGDIRSIFTKYMHFWGSGEVFIESHRYPNSTLKTQAMVLVAPVGAKGFTMNLPTVLTDQLQIEIAAAPTLYEPYTLLNTGQVKEQAHNALVGLSSKNLYNGVVQDKIRLSNSGMSFSSSENDSISIFIPVEFNKNYTLSGLKLGTKYRISGFTSDRELSSNTFVKTFTLSYTDTQTILIDDPTILFIAVALSIDSEGDTLAEAKATKLQVEEGLTATYYEPGITYKATYQALDLLQLSISSIKKRVDGLTVSLKNLFNPVTDVIIGKEYSSTGATILSGGRAATPFYPIAAGQTVSISGMGDIRSIFTKYMHFWGSGEVFIESHRYPNSTLKTQAMVLVAPVGAKGFTMNLPTVLTDQLQIEIAAAPTLYEPYTLLNTGQVKEQAHNALVGLSSKNLYNGVVQDKIRLSNSGMLFSSSENDVISDFIPVEFNKNYTLSGLKLGAEYRISGFTSDRELNSNTFVKTFTLSYTDTQTILIDDPAILFIAVALSIESEGDSLAEAKATKLQVEEGLTATYYEPGITYKATYRALELLQSSIESIDKRVDGLKELVNFTTKIDGFQCLDAANPNILNMQTGNLIKSVGAYGMVFSTHENLGDCFGNNLYVRQSDIPAGKYSLYANVSSISNGATALPELDITGFTTPSGQYDNPNTIVNHDKKYSDHGYTHPSIDYDETGVAGFKYWMIASILPGEHLGDAIWEDEDLFVSNDGKNWERVRSPYETDKSYTTSTLRLPPNDFSDNARKNAFIPVPAIGQVIEVSTPSDNGNPSVDRETVTIDSLSFKHDPAILIDGGYVYVYHVHHLAYNGLSAGSNTFLVCTRTNDGINWECVRSDGSTLPLSSSSDTREIFTKDETGRYNYLFYGFLSGYSNPELIKYGPGDYEMVYGGNFNVRFKGTTPYNIDFTTPYPFEDLGSGNHPGLLLDGSNLYLLNQLGLYLSTDRGENFTPYNFNPTWLGGSNSFPYKKAMTIGDNGNVVLLDVSRFFLPQSRSGQENQFSGVQRDHIMNITKYESVTNLVNLATTGLNEGYIDVQIGKVDYSNDSRDCTFHPYVGNKSSFASTNNNTQKVKLTELDISKEDVIYFYITMTARNNSHTRFNGLELEIIPQ